MSLPAMKRARVGVQQITIYPWNGADGPYDETTGCGMEGLQSLDLTKKSKSAMVKGGETVHVLGAFEVDRETNVKVSAQLTDLRVWAILLGGDFAFDAASPPTAGEVQNYSENLEGRAPYFRLEAASTNGDGKDTFILFKLRLDGNVNFKMDREKVTELEFDAICVFDKVAVKKNGQVGGVSDFVYSEDGVTEFTS